MLQKWTATGAQGGPWEISRSIEIPIQGQVLRLCCCERSDTPSAMLVDEREDCPTQKYCEERTTFKNYC